MSDQRNRMLTLGDVRERADTRFAWTVPCRPQVHTFPFLDRFFAFDANSRTLFEVDEAVMGRIEEAAPEVSSSAEARPLIVDLPVPASCKTAMLQYLFVDREPMVGLAGVKASRAGPSQVVLQLTHRCNLACSYCFSQFDYSDLTSDMPFSVIKSAVNMMDLRARRLYLYFFGGEPLLRPDSIVYGTAALEGRAEAIGCQTYFGMTTNLTMLDEELIKFLREHRFDMVVSMDGPKEVQNKWRPAKSGEAGVNMAGTNSYDATIGQLGRLLDGGKMCRVTLRGTLVGKHYDLVAVAKHHQDLIDQRLADDFTLFHLSAPPGSDLGFEMVEGAMGGLAQWAVGRMIEGRRMGFTRLKGYMAGALYARLKTYSCNAGFKYMAVGPDGRLYACHREGACGIGHIDQGIDERERAKWVDDRVYTSGTCSACWLRFLCGGGCRAHALMSGNIRLADASHCQFRKGLFEVGAYALASLEKGRALRYVRRRGRSVGEADEAEAKGGKRWVSPLYEAGGDFDGRRAKSSDRSVDILQRREAGRGTRPGG